MAGGRGRRRRIDLEAIKDGRYMVAGGAFGAGETVIQTRGEVRRAGNCSGDGQISGDERQTAGDGRAIDV